MSGHPPIVVLGAGGQLGRALVEAATAAGGPVAAHGSTDVDIRDAAAVDRAVAAASGAVVVNAAAFTDVDGAETREAEARAVNVDGAAAVAAACRRQGAALVHISTDYVFSGRSQRPWRPDDPAEPVNAYGRSKRDGEIAVLDRHPEALVVRTSGVYAPWGRNFVTTMLRVGRDRDHLRVVADQVLGPTSAIDLARALVAAVPAVRRGAGGIVHYCGTPETSWHGFAEAIFALAEGPAPRVEAITSAEWPSAAARPAYSMLDVGGFVDRFARRPTPWREALAEVIARQAEGTVRAALGEERR